MRRIALALLLVLAITPPSGARAGGADLLDLLPIGARAPIAEARAAAAAARTAVAADSYGALLRGLLVIHGRGASPPALAAALGDPIAGLDAAARTALAMIGPITPGELTDHARAIREGLGRMRIQPRWKSGSSPARLDPAAIPTSLPPAPAATRAPVAALIVLDALDRFLPALRQRVAGPTGHSAAGCDLVDVPPVLCVGSMANNEYTDDVALLIDLGGNDTYQNAAGGAPFRVPDTDVLLGVSVNVDLGGDDTYLFEGRTTSPNFQVAQGAAVFGAVGILIDEVGSDTYTTTSGVPDPDGTIYGAAIAQGAAVGGIGLLIDAAGSDRYRVDAVPGAGNIDAVGQGAALFCAAVTQQDPLYVPGGGCPVAAIVDRGRGDDTYTLDAGVGEPGSRSVTGQAYANLGLGVFADDGGTDAITAHAEARVPGSLFDFSTVAAFVQASAPLGTALLLEGAGSTRYEVRTAVRGQLFQRLYSQALAASNSSMAVLQDLGGDDTYSLEAALTDHRVITVDDACECASAAAYVEGFPIDAGVIEDIEIKAQAVGYREGARALIDDLMGDDRYTVSALHDLRVTLRDELSAPAAPPDLRVVSYGPPIMDAQGIGKSKGVGVLADARGNDAYVWESRNRTYGEAFSAHATGEPTVDGLGVWGFTGSGQGMGDGQMVGALVDLAGTGDTFEATAERTTTTAPDPGGARTTGWYWPGLQGSGTNGLLVALGTAPRIIAHPSRPVCTASPGWHGFGTWVECPVPDADPSHNRVDASSNGSAGLAPGAQGADPSFTFLTPPAAAIVEGTRLPVAVRVLGPSGSPIAGASIRFDLQEIRNQIVPIYQGNNWTNQWEITATTDAEGIAQVRLPTDVNRFPAYRWPDSAYRVMATFDGAPGVHPDHLVSPLTVQPA